MKLSSKLMMQWLSSILQSLQSYQFYLPKNISLLLLLSIPLTSTLLQALISSCPNYYHDLQSCCPFIHLPCGHWYNFIKHVDAKSLQSCPTLCDPIDGSPPGSPIPGILLARTLEWVAISFSNAWKWKVKSESEVAQSCSTLRDPLDCSLPGSSIHEIFQARVLEWVAIAFSINLAINFPV